MWVIFASTSRKLNVAVLSDVSRLRNAVVISKSSIIETLDGSFQQTIYTLKILFLNFSV